MNAVMFVSSDNTFRLNERVERIKDGSTIYECEADNIDELLEQINEIYDDVDQIKVLLPESDGRLEWEIGSAFPDKQIEYIPENFVRPLYEERLFEGQWEPGQFGFRFLKKAADAVTKASGTNLKIQNLGPNTPLKNFDAAVVNWMTANHYLTGDVKKGTVNGQFDAAKVLMENKDLQNALLQDVQNNPVLYKELVSFRFLPEQQLPAEQQQQAEENKQQATPPQQKIIDAKWPFMPPVKGCKDVVNGFVNQFVKPISEKLNITPNSFNFKVQEGEGWEASYITAYRLVPGISPDVLNLNLEIVDNLPAGTVLTGTPVKENYLDILINKGYKALKEAENEVANPAPARASTTQPAVQSQPSTENKADEGAKEGTNTALTEQELAAINEAFNQFKGNIDKLQTVGQQAVQMYDKCRKSVNPKDKDTVKRSQMLNQFKEKEKGYYQYVSIICSYILGELDNNIKGEMVKMTKQTFMTGKKLDLSHVSEFFQGLFHSIYLGNIGKMISDDFGAIMKDLRNSGFGLFIDGASALMGTAGKAAKLASDKINNKLTKAGNNTRKEQQAQITQQISVNGYDVIYVTGQAEEFNKLIEWDKEPNFYKYNVKEPAKGEKEDDQKNTEGNGQQKQQPDEQSKQQPEQQSANGQQSEKTE